MSGIRLFLLVLILPAVCQAEFFAEGGVGFGGQDVSIQDEFCYRNFVPDTCPNATLGAGGRLAVGYQFHPGDDDTRAVSLAVGTLWGGGTDESIRATVVQLLYSFPEADGWWGFGLSLHIDPEYKEDLSFDGERRLNFDDATGIVARYLYPLNPPNWHLGFQFTLIDYPLDGEKYNANSLGIFGYRSFR